MKLSKETWKSILAIVLKAAIAIVAVVAGAFGISTMNSCTASRIITNEAKYIQRGDTTFVITTKTTENYDAKKGGTK